MCLTEIFLDKCFLQHLLSFPHFKHCATTIGTVIVSHIIELLFFLFLDIVYREKYSAKIAIYLHLRWLLTLEMFYSSHYDVRNVVIKYKLIDQHSHKHKINKTPSARSCCVISHMALSIRGIFHREREENSSFSTKFEHVWRRKMFERKVMIERRSIRKKDVNVGKRTLTREESSVLA